MTDAQRAHLRALAARVRTEEPSDELRDAVLIALGWNSPAAGFEYWFRPDRSPCHIFRLPNPLTSIDAAAGAMPEGWRIWQITQSGIDVAAALYHPDRATHPIRSTGPTEPRARTSAALEAKATEGDA